MKDKFPMRSLRLASVALACVTLPVPPAFAQSAPAPAPASAVPPTPNPVTAPQGATAGAPASPDGLPATLVQALVEAYNNNATLQAQRAALRQADEGVPTALAGWMPTVEVTGTAGRLSETISTANSLEDPTQGSSKYDESFSQTGITGTVTEQLYSGGKTLAQTRQAKNAVYAARAQLLATEETVFLNVVQAYVSVVTDGQVLALDVNNEAVLRQQLKDTTTQFNVGEITMTSVAQARASLAQAIEQVEVATGTLQIARENFRQLVGSYPSDDMVPPQPLVMPVDSKTAAANAAVTNNPNVIAAQFTDAANKDGVNVAYAALMPQIQVQASAYHQVGENNVGSQLKGGSVIGQLTVPLYQGGSEYAAIRAARAKEQQSFAAILDAQRTAYYQGSQAWEAVVATRAAIVASNEQIKANAIALDGTEREELVGTRTTLDVLNAQELLLNSQVQQVQNIGTLVNNTYAVASAVGRLTVRDLGLPVKEYDDLKYYDAVKHAAFGTGEGADRKAGVAPNGTLLNVPPPSVADGGPVP